MSSIKNLEMAAALSAYQHIEIKKSLFSTKAIYTPTQSLAKAIILEYSPSEGERVARLLDMPLDKMAADIQQKGKPATGANGNFRLELCLSDDRQFCAVQLLRFGDFQYKPVFDPRFYEGKDVEPFTKLL
ncbi:MAG: hypothetical protein II886_02080 [Prevotella sp.]|nr:hypothetical protein [Prevotella sp.]